MCLGFREARGFRASLYFRLLWFWGFCGFKPCKSSGVSPKSDLYWGEMSGRFRQEHISARKKMSHVEPRTAEQKVKSDKAAKKHTT